MLSKNLKTWKSKIQYKIKIKIFKALNIQNYSKKL